ncbi:hypothetical protein KC345_g4644 [Hortaea werneckii]|nr:hypothetical protein KC345_g4644 [Hortaea werneckii]
MAEASDFNSDDIVFSPKRQPPKKYGERSIAKMLESAQTDRIETKRVVSQLEFGDGGHKYRANQSLWARRFEVFRERVLKQDIARPFISDDVIRFLACIVEKLELQPGKPAPNRTTISKAIRILISYGQFSWREFEWKRYDSQRIKTWLSDVVNDGKLLRGRWLPRTFLGFPVVSRMLRTYLQHASTMGCSNFDLVISRMLSVVLASSLGARVGDLVCSDSTARGQGYYLQFRHISLSIREEQGAMEKEPRFEHLEAMVELEFTKGYKGVRDTSRWCRLRPLNEGNSSHVCPIALLLTHCLRHGLVAGKSVEDVLQNAWARSDRTIVWRFPNWPVLSTLTRQRCQLEHPASAKQVSDTLQSMAIVAGIVDRVHGHALRLGHANDVANLPSRLTDGASTSLDVVRQSLGHSYEAQYSGLTEGYSGGTSLDFYNLRAKNPAPSCKAPSFAVEEGALLKRVRAPISEEGVEEEEEEEEEEERNKKRKRKSKVVKDQIQDARSTLALEGKHGQKSLEMLGQPSPMPPHSSVPVRLPASQANPAKEIPSSLSTLPPPPDLQVIDPAILSVEEIEERAAGLAFETATELEALV